MVRRIRTLTNQFKNILFLLIIFSFVFECVYSSEQVQEKDSVTKIPFAIYLDNEHQKELIMQRLSFYDTNYQLIIENAKYEDGIVLNNKQLEKILNDSVPDVQILNFSIKGTKLIFEILIEKGIISQALSRQKEIRVYIYNFEKRKNIKEKEKWLSSLKSNGYPNRYIKKVKYSYRYENVTSYFIKPYIPYYLRRGNSKIKSYGMCRIK